VAAEARLYDRLFTQPIPGAPGPDGTLRSFLDDLNPNALTTVTVFVEPQAAAAPPETRFQFERHGYFVTDRFDHRPDAPVFNRTVALKSGWKR
jgi:glutaminyl-tRNA synthetase